MFKYFRDFHFSQIQRFLSYSYILFISYVFLFIFHDNYIDLTLTKYYCYIIGTALFCSTMLLTMIIDFLFISHKWHNLPPLLFILLGMMAFWGVGMLFCADPYNSFVGNTYKCTGLLLYLLGTLSICFLGGYLHWNQKMTWFFILSCTLICFLQVLNRFEIDPLNMYINLLFYEYPQFISTLGNTNYNGAFDCLIVGLMMTLFFQTNNLKHQFLYGISLCVVFAGSICTASDVAFFCIALAFVVLSGFSCKTPIKWFRIWEMMVLFTVPCAIFPYIFHNREEELFIWDITGVVFEGSYLKYQIFFVLGFGLFLLLAYSLLSKYRNGIKFIYKILMLSGIWFGISALVLANSTLFHAESVPLLSSLRIDGLWGNERGDLWQRFMTLFVQAPLPNKLFGYGFNLVFPSLETINLGIRAEEEIADAHSIYFNTLITSGIVGCMFWTAFIGILLYRAIRMIKQKETYGIYVFVGLICILFQGLVIGPQIITTPIILTEFGVFYSMVNVHPQKE